MAEEFEGITIKERKLSDLKYTKLNPVKRTKRGRDTINQSISEVGLGRGVVLGEDDRLIAGNGTVEQCHELGIERVIEIETDGKTLVAVKRTNLDDDQKQRMAMFDNASAKFAVWDAESLAQIKLSGVSVEGIFTEKEFDKIMMPKEDKKNPDIEPEEEALTGELKYYVVVECDDKETQGTLSGYLEEEGYNTMTYEGPKRDA